MSDIETRIVARNKECCRVIDGFVQEYFNCGDSSDNKNKHGDEYYYRDGDDYSSSSSSSRNSKGSDSSSIDSNNEDSDSNRKQGVYRIAVLYGVYHISDLNRRLIEDYQFKIDPQYQCKQYTAWKIPSPVSPSSQSSSLSSSLESSSSKSSPLIFSKSSSLFRSSHFRSSILSIFPKINLFNKNDNNNYDSNDVVDDGVIITSTSINRIDADIVDDNNILNLKASDLVIISILLSIYLFLNAIDWWYLGHFILLAIEQFSSTVDSSNSIRSSSGDSFDSFLQYFNSNDNISNEFIIAVIYIISYIQRHLFLLRKISYVGIQWDRGLFTDL